MNGIFSLMYRTRSTGIKVIILVLMVKNGEINY